MQCKKSDVPIVSDETLGNQGGDLVVKGLGGEPKAKRLQRGTSLVGAKGQVRNLDKAEEAERYDRCYKDGNSGQRSVHLCHDQGPR
jgi:hypothetical protein